MAVHRFQTPDGAIHRVEAPDRASAEAELNRVLGSERAEADMRKKYTDAEPGFSRRDPATIPMLQGATANFGDEITAGFDRIGTLADNVGRRLIGKPIPYTSQQAHDASLKVFREFDARDAAGGDAPLRLAGALLTPGAKASGAFIAGAKTLPKMMARSSLIGAAYGGLAGAGAGDQGNRATSAAGGAAGGGLVGAVLPAGARGAQKLLAPVVQRAADKVIPKLAPLVDRYAPDFSHLTTAGAPRATGDELRVAKALDRAGKRDASAGTVTRKGSIPFQTHGDNVAGIAEVLAQSPGPAQGLIRRTAGNSRAAARKDMKSAIAEGMGGRGDYFESLDKLFQARADEAKSGMSKLGEHLVTLDENSVSALRSDLSRTAIKDAATNALASPDPEVRAAGAALNSLHDRLLDKPGSVTIRVRDAQDISKGLLDASSAAYGAGEGGRGAALKTLGKAIRSNASDPDRGGFSDYGHWLKRYGDDSENIQALELGRGILTNSLDNSPEKLRMTLDDMSDPAKEHFRKGVGEALLTEVRRKGVGAARSLLKDEDFAAKVKLAYPTEGGFSAFMELADEAVNNEARNSRMLDNSRTFARGEAAADLKDEGSDLLLNAATLDLKGLARGGAKAALKALPRRDRSLVGNPKTNALLGEAVTNQDKMTALLNLLELDRQRALAGARPSAALVAPAAQLPSNQR